MFPHIVSLSIHLFFLVVSAKCGIQEKKQRIIFAGKQLQDHTTIQSNHIQEGMTVLVFPRKNSTTTITTTTTSNPPPTHQIIHNTNANTTTTTNAMSSISTHSDIM